MEKEIIPFSDWQRLDLRIGKVISVEDIPDADKLYKLTVDLGKQLGTRTLVAGLKPFMPAEKLRGKKVVIFTNLEPRTMKGIESQGMLLAASSEDESKVSLLVPEEDIEEGSKIR